MADWNWGQIIFQAVATGVIVTALQELVRLWDRRKHKDDDE